MPKAFALITCDSVNIDQATGKHFIFGHFSSIKVSKFPATHSALTFFVGMSGFAGGEHSMEIKFTPPQDPNAAPSPPPKKQFFWEADPPPAPSPEKTLLTQKFNATGPAQRLYSISELKDLPFEKEGEHLLSVWVDGTKLGEVGLGAAK